MAVSKTFPVESIRDAVEAGQQVYGESKLQEAEPKIAALPGTLHWHFIGGVQRNKVRKLLQNFEVIHAIDSLRLASYADGIAEELGLFPKVFLQVNMGGELSKGGFEPDALRAGVEEIMRLKRLEIVGLMCIPPPGPDAESARPWFAALRELRDSLEKEAGAGLPALSMGMSGDYEVAIEEGATHVRVGSAIFGKRAYRVDGELG
ncbi:MAG: YggS family pyridoxal phosphate-dependent enzyme [Verrucomicrobiaceae bacterium]|nr:MAG: YggS family pyridoxal phosphate-dependent enzyme [Verrucomicrobiaceae bacterium]